MTQRHRYRHRHLIAALLLINFTAVGPAGACDLCALHSSMESQSMRAGVVRFGLFEQFTSFDDLQDDDKHVENELNQHMRSSTTQFITSYDFSDTLGLQLNLPYISRRFKRAAEEGLDEDTEAGLGDTSLLGKYRLFKHDDGNRTFNVQLFAGIKAPTGDADRLKEEQAEHHPGSEDGGEHAESEDGEEHAGLKHGGVDHGDAPASAIHGHDLALGSGSWDVPVGTYVMARNGPFGISGTIQYILRTEGSHSYKYADDLLWNVGPIYYAITEHENVIGVRAALSGEYKGKDRGPEGRADDTAINSVFLGPEILGNIYENVWIETGADFPLDIDNSGLQTVPTFRLRGSVTVRF